ncbi:hypothetical protein CANTEDRAFT_116118 [Yamadazyma tenuis ATCC 10573]|uniref:Uncharacterized protein n=1 Tax=Candida tenuis (strain ATCC 10573 / BCRC 21748 / CBS 615 / JCM 9827 / NBRC 10315 / NRRL Y-1498 / VKM Y-70) TaxID=590646 RepID=G3BBW8_CANTC|nr:uncharacterized protein CANTEDRAFT_116118 [Yamadazyma tenuis ATCC 10573]EGV60100.1 hypothetical protein CANTEDRAFT_116118 [Yamadazyma tenuis ATCC 10573]
MLNLGSSLKLLKRIGDRNLGINLVVFYSAESGRVRSLIPPEDSARFNVGYDCGVETS